MIKYALILAVIVSAGFYIDHNATMTERLKWQDKVQEATEKARKHEQLRQQVINDALQVQFNDQKFINDTLNADIDKLRDRPTRSSVSKTAKTACHGVSGDRLSKEDSTFLTRLLAFAAQEQSARIACYSAYDAISR